MIKFLNYIDVSKSINALIGKTLQKELIQTGQSLMFIFRKPGHPGYEQDDSDDE